MEGKREPPVTTLSSSRSCANASRGGRRHGALAGVKAMRGCSHQRRHRQSQAEHRKGKRRTHPSHAMDCANRVSQGSAPGRAGLHACERSAAVVHHGPRTARVLGTVACLQRPLQQRLISRRPLGRDGPSGQRWQQEKTDEQGHISRHALNSLSGACMGLNAPSAQASGSV